jgi:AraC family ethanolamine operon transcriptional activator
VKNRYRPNSPAGPIATQRFQQIASRLAQQQAGLSDAVADFWKRSIVDAMAATIVNALPAENRGPVPSAMRLVRNVEHYLDTAGSRPVHISEICAQFNVSRRSLHRAFDDMLGLGPVTFLRRKRLCAIHTALMANTPATATIGEIAMQHGFIELGRFSHYYRSLFGEYPSETLHMSKRVSRASERRRALAMRHC